MLWPVHISINRAVAMTFNHFHFIHFHIDIYHTYSHTSRIFWELEIGPKLYIQKIRIFMDGIMYNIFLTTLYSDDYND